MPRHSPAPKVKLQLLPAPAPWLPRARLTVAHRIRYLSRLGAGQARKQPDDTRRGQVRVQLPRGRVEPLVQTLAPSGRMVQPTPQPPGQPSVTELLPQFQPSFNPCAFAAAFYIWHRSKKCSRRTGPLVRPLCLVVDGRASHGLPLAWPGHGRLCLVLGDAGFPCLAGKGGALGGRHGVHPFRARAAQFGSQAFGYVSFSAHVITTLRTAWEWSGEKRLLRGAGASKLDVNTCQAQK